MERNDSGGSGPAQPDDNCADAIQITPQMKILVAIESVDVRTGVFFGTSLYAGVPAAGTGANMELCRAGIDLRTARGCAPTASCFGMTILRSLHEPYTP